ncbi:MAG: hypothetical protein WBC85_05260 [Planktotalea sp.]|uniref:hypothetical protein n=1 Tax=Planktotalea sp. TaxID=2029877 RepID=UPI003C71C506
MTIRTWIVSVAAVVAGWLALQVSVMYFTDAAPGAVALFPASDFTTHLPADMAIVGGGAHWIAIKSDTPNLGKSLYAAGALLVLPAGLPGCLPLGKVL